MCRTSKYTKEQDLWIKKNQYGISRKELAIRFNKIFGTNENEITIRHHCQYLGLKNGFTGKYTTETSPRWQKGLSKEEFKSHFTKESFQVLVDCITPKRKYKVGDVFINHGIPRIVLNIESNKSFEERTVPYARYIYEQHYGKQDGDYVYLFADGNYQNNDISNILQVDRHELISINMLDGHKKGEYTKALVDVLKVKSQIRNLKRR